MREPKLIDYFLLTILALIWASAFFNIKIATYSYGPLTIAFLRIFFGAIIKSLVFRSEGNFLICLIAGDRRCSLNKLKKILGKKDVSMANAEEVKENTGFSIGGVAPVAHIKDLDILVDRSLNRFKYVFGAAGHPNCVFKITYDQLIKITNGNEKEISE